jgi:hypothetical protein
MSGSIATGSGHMRIGGADLLISVGRNSALAGSPFFEGLRKSAATTRAEWHWAMFGNGLAAGFGIPV